MATSLLFGAFACADAAPPMSEAGAGTMPVITPGGGGAGEANAGGSTTMAGETAGGAPAGGTAGAANEMAGAANEMAGAANEMFPVPDKLVALTFDDGPNTMATGLVLDKLEAHQVRASFFLIGQNISASTQGVLQRAAGMGCTLENHSYGYSSLKGITANEVLASVNDTVAAIEEFTGTSPRFFRPPNLETDSTMFEAIDYPFAGGVVAGDFPADYGGNPTVEAVTNEVVSGVQDGSIILMHDVQADLDPHPTPEALDLIIPQLKLRGYEFVTLPELFERRGVDPNGMQDKVWDRVPPT